MLTAIIQARMGSTRLPGKSMMPVENQPILGWIINRTKRAKNVDEVVVATTNLPEDDVIEAFCQKEGIFCFRGSSDNVLERYFQAAQERHVDIVVRITADCPFIDPKIIDLVIDRYHSTPCDYASNSLERTFARGMDTEVFSFASLKMAYEQAKKAEEREHVTLFIYRHKELFRLANVSAKENHGDLRLTVDTPEDLQLIRRIAKEFASDQFSYEEILELLTKHPSWLAINAHIQQKTVMHFEAEAKPSNAQIQRRDTETRRRKGKD
jgi:spore coat polysaccharide biosynthesis protein SpsF